jgi:WD40 repeat protein
MKKAITILFILFEISAARGFGQRKFGSNKPYQLYATQIAAAEAFIQLNLISTAYEYLEKCNPKYRGIEWNFLKASLDQSLKTISKPGSVYFTDLKMSPDGKTLAAAGSDSMITLYEYPGLIELRKLKGHNGSVSTIAFSHDGRKLASGGRDHCVIIWDYEAGKMLVKNDHSFTQGIYQLKFSPDNSMIGVVTWERLPKKKPYVFGYAKLLDTDDGKELKKIELDNHPAAGIVFTPDGKNIIVSTWGEIVYSFDIDGSSFNWKYDLSDPSEYNAFHCIDLSPDGKNIAVGSTDHRVTILNSTTGKVVHRIDPWLGHTKIPKAVQFSPDGKQLATAGEDQTVLIWQTDDYSIPVKLTGHVGNVSGLAWTQDGNKVFSASNDGSLREWDLHQRFETEYEICDYGPWQTIVSADRKFFAAPCSDSILIIYEASTGEPYKVLGDQSGLCADISNDSKTLVTASFDGIVRVWDTEEETEVKMFKGHSARIDGVAYLNNSQQILSVGDTTLRVWSPDSEIEIKIVPFNETPFRIAVSPDQTLAVIGFNNGLIRVINTNSWIEARNFRCNNSIQEIAVSPDGAYLAAYSGKDIEIWNLKNGKRKMILKGHEKPGYGIGFSPDGKFLISGSNDQTFKIWNLTSGICTLTSHSYEEVIYSCKFLSENEILISTSEGKIRYYHF